MRAPLILICLVACCLSTAIDVAFTAWPRWTSPNLGLCTAAQDQYRPLAVPDGANGMVVFWTDTRDGRADLYAQRVSAVGVIDPAWPQEGCAISTAVSNKQNPAITGYSNTGAYVVWQDNRSGTDDIYVHRVLASGTVDPVWPAQGLAICTATGVQSYPTVVSDGTGGAIVGWTDYRSGSADIRDAQHVYASGLVDPTWPANGLVVCNATGQQQYPQAVASGTGGAILAWRDARTGTGDIYAQRVLATGAVDPAWPANGRALCTAANDQRAPQVVTDGANGAIVTWEDLRSGTADVYAHRVLSAGTVDGAWAANGLAVCTAANDQLITAVLYDPYGGAFIAWIDARAGVQHDVYVHRVQLAGTVDPSWPANGRAVCTATDYQAGAKLVSDGGGGLIVGWSDRRGGAYDIYTQHLYASGAVDATWTAQGVPVSTVSGDQYNVTMVSDGARGALLAWEDWRGFYSDIFAQRMTRFALPGALEPLIEAVPDVKPDQGGKVHVLWFASARDVWPSYAVESYNLWRQVTTEAAARASASGARGVSTGEAAASGDLLRRGEGAEATYWEFVAAIPARAVDRYGFMAGTTADSTEAGVPWNVFFVDAKIAGLMEYHVSPVDSGYSVDDLAPPAPAPFTGTYAAGQSTLQWGVCPVADLAGYRLYRGTDAVFVPEPANLIAALSGNAYLDGAGEPFWYKLTAVDVHGNESPASALLPSGSLAVEDALPAAFAMSAPMPNPARGHTTLRFALPRAGAVRLTVFDASGRQVRRLVEGVRRAGEHATAWDLRDDAGRAVGAGLYFATLEAGGVRLTRRVMALK